MALSVHSGSQTTHQYIPDISHSTKYMFLFGKTHTHRIDVEETAGAALSQQKPYRTV